MRLDRSRFIYSLAGALLADEWAAAPIRAALRRSTLDRSFQARKLDLRLLAAFAERPVYGPLVDFLMADRGLARAIARAAAAVPTPSPRFPRRRVTMGPAPLWLAGPCVPAIATEQDLAAWFAMDIKRLKWRADVSGRNRRHPPGPLRPYRYRWVSRREGMARLLEIPKAPLKRMQRKVLSEILSLVPTHPSAHGFRRGRSILTNAAAHCGKEAVLRLDLTDFFPSVTSARIFRAFRALGYPADVARLLMGLCTTSLPADVWEGRPGARLGADDAAWQRLRGRHLPQGAPTSPALANLAAARLDRRLDALARAAGFIYTRYADDLTFSGSDELARSSKRLATHVAVIAADEGFSLNHRKTRLMRCGVRQSVTGVVVNVRPNITRAAFDRLKAILTNCVRHGPASQSEEPLSHLRASLAGTIAQIGSIHPARGAKLRGIYDRISWAADAEALPPAP